MFKNYPSPIKILIIGFLFLAFGCQKDELEETDTQHTKEIFIEELSFKDLSNSSSFDKIGTTMNLRSIRSSLNGEGFVIDPDRIKKIIAGGNISYNFLIRRETENPGFFENLVVSQRADGTIKSFLIKYSLTQKVQKVEGHSSFNFEAMRSIQPVHISEGEVLFQKSSSCFEFAEAWCNWGVEDHVAGEQCLEEGGSRIFYKMVEYCDTGSDGNPVPGEGSETPVGDGGPVPGDGSETGDDGSGTIITSPVNPDGTSAAPDFLISILGLTNSNEMEFLYTNPELAEKFLVFIRNNGSTSNIKFFVKAAIKSLMEGGEVNLENKFIKDPSFIGTKAECVLDQLVSTGNNIFRKSSEAFTGGRSQYRLKFTTYFDPGDPANARTPLPNSNGIIEIRFNLAMTALYTNSTSLGLATDLLHEVNHAELHRIKLSENSGPNPLTQAQYNYYIELWDYFNKPGEYIGEVAGDAEHYYMAKHLIDPISNGLREFENYSHSSFHYRHFAWQGLISYGKLGGFITETELDENAILAKTVLNDDYISPCDK